VPTLLDSATATVEVKIADLDAKTVAHNVAVGDLALHWSLDMTYREDESRVRNRTLADNLSWLRRLTLSLIKQHPGKQSNIMKRRMAGWSVDFLMQLLTGKGP